MKILGIIPARYDSSRFPGKPLAILEGKTMLQRVYEQCIKAECLNGVIVATDDKRVYQAVQDFGGEVRMTSSTHLNGTTRCAEVAEVIQNAFDYVINIQGDEPLINPQQIDNLAGLFKDINSEIITQVKQETNLFLLKNTNIVKARLDGNNFAIDFKRTIQDERWLQDVRNDGFFYKHIGIYGFRTDVLKKLAQLTSTENEMVNHLEQLRWLDNGFNIKIGITEYESISVDTVEDLKTVIAKLKEIIL